MMSERYFSKEFKTKTTERNAQSYYIVVVGNTHHNPTVFNSS